MARPSQSLRRAAFTLVELLVVIAIIAVLVAISAAAIFPLLTKGPEMKTRNEITQLNNAIQNYKSSEKSGKNHPPSRIKLAPYYSQYIDLTTMQPKTPLDAESLQYINKLWPSLSKTPPVPGNPALKQGDFNDLSNPGARGIPWHDSTWNYTAQGALPKNVFWVLEGDQCLVFFLSGIPDGMAPRGLGFSTDPLNPAVGNNRTNPIFEFDAGRLVKRNGSPFYSYVDHYGKMPYFYFSSGLRENGYNLAHTTAPSPSDAFFTNGVPPVGPYMLPNQPTKFNNPKTFQIISAGADKLFNPGRTLAPFGQIFEWSPKTALAIPQEGRDDMTNFHDRVLGSAD